MDKVVKPFAFKKKLSQRKKRLQFNNLNKSYRIFCQQPLKVKGQPVGWSGWLKISPPPPYSPQPVAVARLLRKFKEM